MDISALKENLIKISQQFQSRGKQSSIDLYLAILESTRQTLVSTPSSGKTLFIGYTGSSIEVSIQSSPHSITQWSELNKTEMNLVVGPWEYSQEGKRFIETEQTCFFLESWHGYIIGELNPFLITEDQLRYNYRKVS